MQHKYIEKIFRNFDINNIKLAVTFIETKKIETLLNKYKYSFKGKNWYAKVIKLLMYTILEIYVNITYFILFFDIFLKNSGF